MSVRHVIALFCSSLTLWLGGGEGSAAKPVKTICTFYRGIDNAPHRYGPRRWSKRTENIGGHKIKPHHVWIHSRKDAATAYYCQAYPKRSYADRRKYGSVVLRFGLPEDLVQWRDHERATYSRLSIRDDRKYLEAIGVFRYGKPPKRPNVERVLRRNEYVEWMSPEAFYAKYKKK